MVKSFVPSGARSPGDSLLDAEKFLQTPKSKISKTNRKGTSLLSRAVGGRARRRYDRGCAAFSEWCHVSNRSALGSSVESGRYLNASELERLDLGLSEYFEYAYHADPSPTDLGVKCLTHPITSRWEGSELLCGITDRFPEARRHLPRATRCLVAWQREEQVARAPPVPVSTLLCPLPWLAPS